jgi:hypothetical protein
LTGKEHHDPFRTTFSDDPPERLDLGGIEETLIMEVLPAPFMPPIRKMLRPSSPEGNRISVANWKDL